MLFLVASLTGLILSCLAQNEVIKPAEDRNITRSGKALSVFQVVRFPNIGCVGTSSLNGTCYTTSECTNKGGVSSGSCASGFGVCCTFTLGCGSVISENCTYFQSSLPSQPAGQCGATICKCSSDICQLRLDFNTFVITGPNTFTISSLTIAGGSFTPLNDGMKVSEATVCLTDTFSVTGNGNSPPVICGTNTGYHRCTQYYTGLTNYFNSYNYASSVQLANQRQTVCMRRERGYCRMCISTSSAIASTDFSVSGTAMSVNKGYNNAKCCGYGTMGIIDTEVGYDCLIIPNAVKAAAAISHLNNKFCGRYLVSSPTAATGSKTICTTQIPFNVQFITDAYTNFYNAMAPGLTGFKLIYYQTTC